MLQLALWAEREAELPVSTTLQCGDRDTSTREADRALPDLLKSGSAAFPSFVSGCGPFPHAVGGWRNKPTDPADLRTVIGLYLALMADASLSLIESRDQLVIGGQFAEDPMFVWRTGSATTATTRVCVAVTGRRVLRGVEAGSSVMYRHDHGSPE